MKRRIMSVVTLIAFLATLVFSVNGSIAKAADFEVRVPSPDNMLDVSVVDKEGNLISGIRLTLVDSSGNEVAAWNNGSVNVSVPGDSNIKTYKKEEARYPIYVWKMLEEVSKVVGTDSIYEIYGSRDGSITPIYYRAGDSLSAWTSYNESFIRNCVINYL